MREAVITINQRMINTLLLHSSFIDNLGLLNGKMGISIFFYHLARKTGNPIYEDYAGELIDEIYEDINLNTPLDFANGLAGIGWGIEYLVQNHFIEADADDVFGEIDKRLMPLIHSLPPSLGLCQGVIGLGAYLLKRIQNPGASDEKIQTLINKQSMIHLISELDRRTQDVSDLIREPSPEHHDNETSQGVNPDKNQGEPATFDLTWDYPMLLAFFTEVFHLHVYNVKVNSILQRLILPMLEAENHPQLHANRLLLALAIEKIKYCKSGKLPINFLNKITRKLLSSFNREAIFNELAPMSTFLQSGTLGISFIYHQLYKLTNNSCFIVELAYWKSLGVDFPESNQGYAGLYVKKENENKAFGLLNGLAGIGLSEIIKFDHLIVKP